MKTEIYDIITRVLELDEKATPGPWNVATNRHPSTSGEEWGDMEAISHPAGGCGNPPTGMSRMTWKGNKGRSNAALIAFYRTATPELARQCQQLAKALEVAKAALQEIKGYEAPHREGICPYGCDTPHIATTALTEINNLTNL